jgi:hypothetical protein
MDAWSENRIWTELQAGGTRRYTVQLLSIAGKVRHHAHGSLLAATERRVIRPIPSRALDKPPTSKMDKKLCKQTG